MQDLQRIAPLKRGRARAIASALAAAALLGGCGSEPSRAVPVACKAEIPAIDRALAAAPGEVRLGGRTISDCFSRPSDSADIQALGLAYLPVVERLADAARAHPRGAAALRLGFLVAAIHRGAGQAQGVFAQLERRIDQELIGVRTASPAYRRGARAGRVHG